MKQRVVLRAKDAGVFYGEIVDRKGDEVEMRNVRRIWYWQGAASLSQLAMEGVKEPNECKFTMVVDSCTIFGVIEIIPCTEAAMKNIDAVPVWKVQ